MTSKKKIPEQIASDKLKEDKKTADLLTHTIVSAARTISKWQPDIDFGALANTIKDRTIPVLNGNMRHAELILMSQAHTLDEIFNNLAIRAKDQTHMPHLESFMRLALKSQAQCRQTLETLSTIKNPPVIFAKQANISNGHQQVNNCIATQAENNQKQQNELLENTHGERLDIRTKGETIEVNTAKETVGKIHRS